MVSCIADNEGALGESVFVAVALEAGLAHWSYDRSYPLSTDFGANLIDGQKWRAVISVMAASQQESKNQGVV